MTQTFENIWISSVAHLDEFNVITKANGWWKTIMSNNMCRRDDSLGFVRHYIFGGNGACQRGNF